MNKISQVTGVALVAAVALALVGRGVLAQEQEKEEPKYTVRCVIIEGKGIPGAKEVWKPSPTGEDKKLPSLAAGLDKFLAALKVARPGWNWSVTLNGALTYTEKEQGEAEFHYTDVDGKNMVFKLMAENVAMPPDADPTVRQVIVNTQMIMVEGRRSRIVNSPRVRAMVGIDSEIGMVAGPAPGVPNISTATLIILSPSRGGLWEEPSTASLVPSPSVEQATK